MTDTIPATVKTQHTALVVGNGGLAHGAEFEIRLADDADTYVAGIQWANPGQDDEGYMLSYEQASDLAAFIVRACNSHYQLVSALREAIEELWDRDHSSMDRIQFERANTSLFAALSQAGGASE